MTTRQAKCNAEVIRNGKDRGEENLWTGSVGDFIEYDLDKDTDISEIRLVFDNDGGFYTQYTTALDTRIRSAISCSYFNERKACFHADWSWKGSAKRLQDAELACLVYPRRLCIELGRSDELFACESGIAEFERLKALCAPLGTDADWLDFILYDGTHEFCREDAPIKRLVEDIEI